MNELEALTYDTKALLEVVSDGLLNQDCPSNLEDSATVIRQAINKLEEVREIHEQMWEKMRKPLADGGADEDADEEEDSDSEELLPGELFEDEEDNTSKSPTRFDVKEISRNEDGSATYQIGGSAEEMSKLFEAFFTSALIQGIKHAEGGNKKEVAKIAALEVAREFETLMRIWEDSDDLDYDPACKEKREELSKALKEAGV